MPITYVEGDATRPVVEGPKIIVHVCNDRGGWGKGFVVAVSRRWPEPEREYRAWAKGERDLPFELGRMQLVDVTRDLAVANVIGQEGMRPKGGVPPVRYEAIREGLEAVRDVALERGASVHMPRIGCGLAGGRWEEMEPVIEAALVDHGVPVTVYDFVG